MLKVGICDDPPSIVQSRSLIENVLKEQNWEYEIIEFDKTEKLYDYLKIQQMDLLFLTLEMGQDGGLAIACRLAKRQYSTRIVFLTEGLQHYSSRVYEVEHLYLIIKNELELYLPLVFNKIKVQDRQKSRQRIMVTGRGRQRVVIVGDILYLERNKRVTQIVCEEERICSSSDLNTLLEEIKESCFIRCHNSYAINFNYVKEFRRTEFLLNNNDIIPISRRYQPEVRRKLLAWMEMV